MDQFSTEEEQIEAVKKFWKENGIPIVVGAALGLGGLWGWRFYNAEQLQAQSQASDAYNTAIEALAGDSPDLTTVQSFIDSNNNTVYAVMAALQLAKEAVEAKDLDEALHLVNDHEFGNGVSIFTRDGDAGRTFYNKAKIGMVGINIPIPVPMAYHSFGGWKRSLFGAQHMHGPEGVRFYTKLKTITSRWPSGLRSDPEFVMPTMK